ncbi:tetratricopeptide repeat protein [Nocardia sp. NPDC059177]|uniref:serine/threonine-protein kinase n=1 Tax=Nocardia sp. NPDC059177 TaxID=3346759 RepID=UPI00369302D2
MTCSEPGCGGTVEDGYCALCGTAPVATASAPSSPPSSSGRSPRTTAQPRNGAPPPPAPGRCGEPECGGTIVDGYCETCGTAPTSTVYSPSAPTISERGRTSSRSVRTRSGSARSAARGRLGAGLVEVPPVPRVDPATAVLADPQVPESDRYCGKCDKPVGRSHDGVTGRTAGFCPHCGTRYSFVPRLRAGDLVGGQYEVAGALAHGGLGWIYLATDHRVNRRWVVLKGLIDTGDPDALAAALAERRFLAEVDHPNIVKIHNFTEHVDADGDPVGYIVMAYVGGTSLKQILRAHRAETQCYLPPAQAIAYVLEMLPALGYLHARGWAYCDFKPDNVMQTEERLELIDLGAVIAMDDRTSPIYGTLGYQAPEIAETGPTVATEVYTAGRTLAVLMMRVPSVDGRLGPLPTPDTEPILAEHDSLYRFLLRATDPDPLNRFASMSEMADQLTGVLREVLATADGIPRPGMSSSFGPARAVFGIDSATPEPAALVTALPAPLVDPGDSGAALLATTDAATPAELEQALTAGQRAVVSGAAESTEIPLRLVRAELEAGDATAALHRLAALDAELEYDWRPVWYRAQAALLTGEHAAAAQDFESVYAALPGESAPKLALAAALELGVRSAEATTGTAELRRALELYDLVWHTDHTYLSAAFGAARLRRALDDRTGAVAVLDQVDRSSSMFTEARVSAVETLLAGRAPADLDETLLREAGERVERLRLDSRKRAAQVRMYVLEAALNWIRSGQRPSTAGKLLDVEFTEQGVRTGLERCLRTLARDADDMWTRFVLVDQANAVRPRTTL